MRNILVCDSEIELCNLISDILERKGFKVYSTPSGRRALYLLKTRKMALIISGVDLLDIGYDGFVSELGKLPDHPELVRIKKIKDEVFEKVTDVISLPLSEEELLTVIENNLEKEGEIKKKSKLKYYLIPLILCFGFLYYFLFKKEEPDIIRILPSGNISGIYFEKVNVYLVDWFQGKIFIIPKAVLYGLKKALGGDSREIILKNYSPYSIAVFNNSIWVTDIDKKLLLRLDMSETPVVLEKLPLPGPSPCGIWYDGLALFSADTTYKKVYRHNIDGKLSVLDVISCEVKYLSGFFIKNKRLYVADGDDNTVMLFDEYFNPTKKYKLKYYENKKEKIGAIGFDGKNIVTIPDGSDRLIIHSKDRLVKMKIKKNE